MLCREDRRGPGCTIKKVLETAAHCDKGDRDRNDDEHLNDFSDPLKVRLFVADNIRQRNLAIIGISRIS